MKHTLNVRIKKNHLERHCLIVGATGAGKSLLMQSMFYDLVRTSNARRQHSVILIEPHGDFSSKIAFAKIIPKDRLVYISSTINREAKTEGYCCTINPFENDGSEHIRYLLTTELTAAIGELLADTSTPLTVQMTMLLRNCISITLKTKDASLETLCRFFLDKDNQNADLRELGKQSDNPRERTFFTHDFQSQEYTLTKRSIRTKLLYFLSDTLLFSMLCGKSTVNLEQCLEQGKVIIFQIPKGASKFVSSVFGRLMIAYINTIILRREAVASHLRKPAFLFIDEFGTLLTASVSSSLQEIRKYRLSLILATQSLKQIESTVMKKTVMVNTGIKAISLSDSQDRVEFAREMGVSTDSLATLEPLHFMIKHNDGKSSAFRFKVKILSKHLFYQGEERQALLDSLIQSGMYVKETIPPPPPPPLLEYNKIQVVKARNINNDNPFNGHKPAF
jgi:energy-coupling factor transporter ATP-binding protein EcfA2